MSRGNTNKPCRKIDLSHNWIILWGDLEFQLRIYLVFINGWRNAYRGIAQRMVIWNRKHLNIEQDIATEWDREGMFRLLYFKIQTNLIIVELITLYNKCAYSCSDGEIVILGGCTLVKLYGSKYGLIDMLTWVGYWGKY